MIVHERKQILISCGQKNNAAYLKESLIKSKNKFFHTKIMCV